MIKNLIKSTPPALEFPFDVYYDEYIKIGGEKSSEEYMELIELVRFKSKILSALYVEIASVKSGYFTEEESLIYESMERATVGSRSS